MGAFIWGKLYCSRREPMGGRRTQVELQGLEFIYKINNGVRRLVSLELTKNETLVVRRGAFLACNKTKKDTK